MDRDTKRSDVILIRIWPGQPDTRRRTEFREVRDTETVGDIVAGIVEETRKYTAVSNAAIVDDDGHDVEVSRHASDFKGKTLYIFDESRRGDRASYFGSN